MMERMTERVSLSVSSGEEGRFSVDGVQELRVVPCPFCGVTDTHTGTCELSNMRTGKWFAVVALAVERVEPQKVGGLEEFSRTVGEIQEMEPRPDPKDFDNSDDYYDAHREWFENTQLWRGVDGRSA